MEKGEVKLKLIKAIYLVHISVLKEASEGWVVHKYATPSGLFFFEAVKGKREGLQLFTCNRTYETVNNSKLNIGYNPGLLSIITPIISTKWQHLPDEEYFLKIASILMANPEPVFLITSDSSKKEIQEIATTLSYNINIKSCSEFLNK